MKDREESKDIMTSWRTCSSETDQTEDEDPFMTDEWIREMCHSDDDVPVRVKCTRCGHEENIPRWLVAEVTDALVESGGSADDAGFECPRCHGHMKIKS